MVSPVTVRSNAGELMCDQVPYMKSTSTRTIRDFSFQKHHLRGWFAKSSKINMVAISKFSPMHLRRYRKPARLCLWELLKGPIFAPYTQKESQSKGRTSH